jgi:hypothetical protein
MASSRCLTENGPLTISCYGDAKDANFDDTTGEPAVTTQSPPHVQKCTVIRLFVGILLW